MKDFSTLPYIQNSVQHMYEDAPYDNHYYLRKDGEWVPVEATEAEVEPNTTTIQDVETSKIQAV